MTIDDIVVAAAALIDAAVEFPQLTCRAFKREAHIRIASGSRSGTRWTFINACPVLPECPLWTAVNALPVVNMGWVVAKDAETGGRWIWIGNKVWLVALTLAIHHRAAIAFARLALAGSGLDLPLRTLVDITPATLNKRTFRTLQYALLFVERHAALVEANRIANTSAQPLKRSVGTACAANALGRILAVIRILHLSVGT